MRTLSEITGAVRAAQEYTAEEARYAIVAYDVLIAQLSLELDPIRLKKYFIAAQMGPAEYIGWANDPENSEAVKWYEIMTNIEPGERNVDET